MARFFLHVFDRGQVIRDPDGLHCESRDEARQRAFDAINELIADGAWDLNSNSDRYIAIADADDRALEIVQLWQATERNASRMT